MGAVAVLGQPSVRATAGGVALLVAPSGAVVGLPSAPLDGTPFGDFLVPGVVLLAAFGLTTAVARYALYTRRRWGRTTSVGVAVAMLIWAVVEGASASIDRRAV